MTLKDALMLGSLAVFTISWCCLMAELDSRRGVVKLLIFYIPWVFFFLAFALLC